MTTILLTTAVLATLTVLVHSILGEWLILTRLEQSNLPAIRGSRAVTHRTLRFAWHITSVFGLCLAALLAYYAIETSAADPLVLRLLSVTFLVSFVVALLGSRGQHPSWIVFLVLGLMLHWVVP